VAVGHEPLGHVEADEPGGAGQENVGHRSPRITAGWWPW
jgi:hypothetical protein